MDSVPSEGVEVLTCGVLATSSDNRPLLVSVDEHDHESAADGRLRLSL